MHAYVKRARNNADVFIGSMKTQLRARERKSPPAALASLRGPLSLRQRIYPDAVYCAWYFYIIFLARRCTFVNVNLQFNLVALNIARQLISHTFKGYPA